jgi:hypothetical protein
MTVKMGQNPTSFESIKLCPGGTAEGPSDLRRGARPPARGACFAAHVARPLALSPWSEARGNSRVATGACALLRAALATGHGSMDVAPVWSCNLAAMQWHMLRLELLK